MNTNYTVAKLNAASTAPKGPDPRQLRQMLKNWPKRRRAKGAGR